MIGSSALSSKASAKPARSRASSQISRMHPMLLSKTVRASWSIAAVLLVAVPPDRIARADNTTASEGAFRHLQALQDIASASGGNRAAGTPGYDRSAEYVAERLREAGYAVRFEEFEFPFFEDR